ncbi:MAG: penicillin-binding protein 2 [Magnetospirillum sp. WYHS-4]
MSGHIFSRVDYSASRNASQIRVEGARKQAVETGRSRLIVTGALFAAVFSVIAGRTVMVAVIDEGHMPSLTRMVAIDTPPIDRADIVDRNGVVLATSLPTSSLFANPREILNPAEAAARLVEVFPDMDRHVLETRLSSKGQFVWLRRNITPNQQYEVHRLGLPGIEFRSAERRLYPQGSLASHIVGLTDIDGRGIAGVEKTFDGRLAEGGKALHLSIDVRAQAMLIEELAASQAAFSAIGAAGVVLDARTGEIVAMASLPDFDPNQPATMVEDTGFNRVAKGVYELGSMFKVFNTAIALDTGIAKVTDSYDARQPIHYAGFTISDYHPENRWLTVEEIFVTSSNIGSAKIALDIGGRTQKAYLQKLGMLEPVPIELPEVTKPLYPTVWREINTMTISYGHGISVSPLHLATAVGAVVNGGVLRTATLLKRTQAEATGTRVFSDATSREMRRLMQRVVAEGTGKQADVPGYQTGGKTGTADKKHGHGYSKTSKISSFVGAFPMEDPRYVILVMVDEPHGTKKTYGFATAGWVAAPLFARVAERLGPLLGVQPNLIEVQAAAEKSDKAKAAKEAREKAAAKAAKPAAPAPTPRAVPVPAGPPRQAKDEFGENQLAAN